MISKTNTMTLLLKKELIRETVIKAKSEGEIVP